MNAFDYPMSAMNYGGMQDMNPYIPGIQNQLLGGMPHYENQFDTNPYLPGVQNPMLGNGIPNYNRPNNYMGGFHQGIY